MEIKIWLVAGLLKSDFMLISFDYLFKKYGVTAKGVLHCGSSTGQENDAYHNAGVERIIWVEAIPEVFSELVSQVFNDTGSTICINACISDEDDKEVVFHVSSNEGQSSSFLELGTHAIVHPNVSYVRDIKCTTKRIDTIFRESNLDIKDYPFINFDLQGSEMYALRGMGEMLNEVQYAYLEVNKAHLYVGCSLVEEIDEYLAKYNLFRVETEWAGNTNWGDAFFIKR